MSSITEATDACLTEILMNNPMLTEGTKSTYRRQIDKLIYELSGANEDAIVECDPDLRDIPKALLDKGIVKYLMTAPWTAKVLSDRTKKNYMSVLLSVLRGLATENEEVNELLLLITEAFNILKDSINAGETSQKPKAKEISLVEVNGMDDLLKNLKPLDKTSKENAESAMLFMIGMIHCEMVFRNELCDMIYIDEIEHTIDPSKNYLINIQKNKKKFIINNNKVRKAGKGDAPKEISFFSKPLNTAINRYVKMREAIGEPLKNNDSLIGKPREEWLPMTNANYTYIFKSIWGHKKEEWGELTSTSIRKIYAMDIRRKYGGKWSEEVRACKVLDHDIPVHNKSYIIDFD